MNRKTSSRWVPSCWLQPLAVVAFAMALSSCQSGRGSGTEAEGDSIPMAYAKYLSMVSHDGYTEVVVTNPWHEGSELHRYLLVPKGKEGDETARMLSARRSARRRTDIVRTPVVSSVQMIAPHCQLMYDLGCADAIKGVCDMEYVNIPDLHRRAAQGAIANCGSSMQPAIERIIALRPEAIVVSPFDGNGGYGKLAKIGIPIVEAADYMETSPLGRAEWMKFYGMLFGTRRKDEFVTCGLCADSLFQAVSHEYERLRRKAAALPLGLSILTERKMGSVWYVPGGKSTMGILLKDAHARYVFAADTHNGSLSLSPEQIIDKADDIDVWAFKYIGSKPLSRADLLREDPGCKAIRAFREGAIYECNTGVVPYFEQTSFHPERLLREFILLSHPYAKGLGRLTYYQPLP